MSTSEEIQEVFERDIAEKSKIVASKKNGLLSFLGGLESCSVQELFYKVLDEDDRDLLKLIYAKDIDWQKDDRKLTPEEIIELLMEIADE